MGFFDTPMSEAQRSEMQDQTSGFRSAQSAVKQAADRKAEASRGCFARGFFKGASMGIMASMTAQQKQRQAQASETRHVDYNPTTDKGKSKDDDFSL